MSILNNFVGFFKINRSAVDEDIENDEDELYEGSEYEAADVLDESENQPPYSRAMHYNTTPRHDEQSRSGVDRAERNIGRINRSSFSRGNSNITPVSPVKGQPANMELSHVKPTTFNDSRFISDCIKEQKVVILNMDGINNELAQRIIDFASGVAYYSNGKLKRITGNIFIVAPEVVSMSGKYDDVSSSDPMSMFAGRTM